MCLDGRALVAGGIGGSPGGRFVLCVIGVSSMFGGMVVLGTITVSNLEQQEWHWLREIVVVDDPVVMMDVVVSQVVHLVVNAFHHLVCHHLVVVVIETVCEKDHHQEESRDSACEDHRA